MSRRRRVWSCLWIAAVVPALAGLVGAQGPKKKLAEAGDNGKEPAQSAPADETPKREAKKADKVDLPKVVLPDPAVEAVLDSKPTTPVELIRAGKALADLRRPDLAREHFKKVLDAGLDAKALAALVDELGSELFVEIGARQELSPEARQLASAVLGAKTRRLQEPERLSGLIQKLQDTSPEVRFRAIAGLQEAGLASVGPLVAVLADSKRTGEHPAVRAALVALGADVYGPMAAMLDASDPRLVLEAIRVLGTSRSTAPVFFLLGPCCREKKREKEPEQEADAAIRQAAQAAVKRIWGSIPPRDEAARLLVDLSRRYTQRREPMPEDPAGQVVVWSWDEGKKQPVSASHSPEDAARWFAARFARDAHAILPESKEVLLVYLTSMLEQAAHQNGLDKPLGTEKGSPAATVSSFPPEVVEEVLAYAMTSAQSAAATAAAQILGSLPNAGQLLYRKAEPRPLVLATRHPDRRLRRAAVEAVVRMRPAMPFAGASYVTEALGFMASSSGACRVLIGAPRVDDAMRLAGYLTKLGYQVDSATTGRGVLQKAFRSADYELIFVEAILSDPTVDFLLQSLRRDGRTALVPVGVLARSGDLGRAWHLARHDPLAAAFSRPHNEETVRWQVEQLLARSARNHPLSPAQRLDHAALALDWLAELSGPEGPRWYDLSGTKAAVVGALDVPELAVKATVVLANFGSPDAQRTLVDLASRTTAPLALRKAALGAFRNSVERWGILLTVAQIRLQYERYNQSAHESAATRAVLGMILDCIEAPSLATQNQQRTARLIP